MSTKLSALLVQDRVVGFRQMDEAVQRQRELGGRIGTSLLELGYIDPDVLLYYVSKQRHMQALDDDDLVRVDPDALAAWDADQAVQLLAIPIAVDRQRLLVAVAEPLPDTFVRAFRTRSGLELEQALTLEFRLWQALGTLHGVDVPERYRALAERYPAPVRKRDPRTSDTASVPAVDGDSPPPPGPPEFDADGDTIPGLAWTGEELTAFFRASTNRDHMLLAALGFVGKFFARRMLHVVTREGLRGYAIHMPGHAPRSIGDVRIEVDDDSTLGRIIAGGTYYYGPVHASGAGPLYDQLGVSRPPDVCIVPVQVGPRAILVLVADAGDAPIEPQALPVTFLAVNRLSAGLERLIRRIKIRRSADYAAIGPDPDDVAETERVRDQAAVDARTAATAAAQRSRFLDVVEQRGMRTAVAASVPQQLPDDGWDFGLLDAFGGDASTTEAPRQTVAPPGGRTLRFAPLGAVPPAGDDEPDDAIAATPAAAIAADDEPTPDDARAQAGNPPASPTPATNEPAPPNHLARIELTRVAVPRASVGASPTPVPPLPPPTPEPGRHAAHLGATIPGLVAAEYEDHPTVPLLALTPTEAPDTPDTPVRPARPAEPVSADDIRIEVDGETFDAGTSATETFAAEPGPAEPGRMYGFENLVTGRVSVIGFRRRADETGPQPAVPAGRLEAVDLDVRIPGVLQPALIREPETPEERAFVERIRGASDDQLIAWLLDENDRVSRGAFVTLLDRGQQAHDALIAHFPGPLLVERASPSAVMDPKPLERHGPLIWLVALQLRSIYPRLRELTSHEDADARYYACRLLQQADEVGALDVMADRLFDTDAQIRDAALQFLDRHLAAEARRHSPIVASIRARLAARESWVVDQAITIASRLRDETAIPSLMAVLDHTSDRTRHKAAQALTRLTLQDFGVDRRKWERWYGRHGRDGHNFWLLDAMVDKEWKVRDNAARELRATPRLLVNYHADLDKKGRESARRAVHRHLFGRDGGVV